MAIYKIGRDYDRPIKIDDKSVSVSHDHARIEIEGNTWTLIDNNSTNGTWIEENGTFRQCHKEKITPNTWIRLGNHGHRGHYFKARRVLRPNDYSEDFSELAILHDKITKVTKKLESKRSVLRFLTPLLTISALAISCLAVKDFVIGRIIIALPGVLVPIIQYAMLASEEKKVKHLRERLICPKCRRSLTRDDIMNRSHVYCKAY